jgi:hypothetical protein
MNVARQSTRAGRSFIMSLAAFLPDSFVGVWDKTALKPAFVVKLIQELVRRDWPSIFPSRANLFNSTFSDQNQNNREYIGLCRVELT